MCRNKFKSYCDSLNRSIEQETADVERFKEEKMCQLLDFNVELADLQNRYSAEFGKTSERRRFLQNIEEQRAEKR